MRSQNASGGSRLSLWLRVRRFAVPPSMIETATARRHAGDWAGACAAAGIDVDLNLRSLARTHGPELAARIRADLRHLAPDLMRWHMPRIAPDGLLRPDLTVALARYATADGGHPVHLVARTPPAWADAGQRISLALWDGSRAAPGDRRHPHPHPGRRFRLDLHRHLWDARRTDELRIRSGAGQPRADARSAAVADPLGLVPQGRGCAVDRWAAEAGIVLRAGGRSTGTVTVRLATRLQLALDVALDTDPAGPPAIRAAVRAAPGGGPYPVLPDAATWVPPDLELLRAGLIAPGELHPLVASALAPGQAPPNSYRGPDRSGAPRLVECRGATHRIGLVNGVLSPLDHDPAELRREELLAALTGTPLPCLRVIDEAHRHPECLPDVRARLDHGDTAGALAVVEGLLGPGALLRSGDLRDELEEAARRRITHGLFRADLIGPRGPVPAPGRASDRRRVRTRVRARTADGSPHPRHATFR